ncbi:ALQxL family class IV lanthipeptide [Sphaerimonospora mesophila]
MELDLNALDMLPATEESQLQICSETCMISCKRWATCGNTISG